MPATYTHLARLTLFFVIGFTTPLTATAQPKTGLGIRTLALDKSATPAVFIKTPDGKISPLEFSSIQPTPPQRAIPSRSLPLYVKKKNPESEKIQYTILQTVKLPTRAKSILLLTWRGSDKKSKFRAIKDNIATARFNDWLLINTTADPVYLQVESKTKPLLLPTAASKLYHVRARKGTGTSVIAKAIQTDSKGKKSQKIIFSSYLPVHSDKRFILLFFNDGKRTRLKDISDKLPNKKTLQ